MLPLRSTWSDPSLAELTQLNTAPELSHVLRKVRLTFLNTFVVAARLLTLTFKEMIQYGGQITTQSENIPISLIISDSE